MPQYVKVNGALKSIETEYVKVNGTMRKVCQKYVKVAGVLKNILAVRDFSSNKWYVLSTNYPFYNPGYTIQRLVTTLIRSKSDNIYIDLQSTTEFLKGDTIKISFQIETKYENISDAIGQQSSITVYNSNDSANSITLKGYSPADNSIIKYTDTLILSQNGYLNVGIWLEGCGDEYFTVSPTISINNKNL